MLNWLAGQKQPDGPNDPDATGYSEPPETPAPVFAVRAFKHAIFGTPQTVQPNPRRHSNTEYGRPRNIDLRPSRPTINRPRSSNDTQTLTRQEVQLEEEPPVSPTKGILLSPGTAAARKKNVTFGENVVDNEDKRPLRSGLTGDSLDSSLDVVCSDSTAARKRDPSPEKSKSRTKLAEALEQAREETKKRKWKTDKRAKSEADDHIFSDELAEPQSQAGKYWKHEYDIYRTNTQREVKKLITKQKAAKSFAMMKDTQCTELADQLRQEQKKVEKLEVRTAELTSLIERLRKELRASRNPAEVHESLKVESKPPKGFDGALVAARPDAADGPHASEQRDRWDRAGAPNRSTRRSSESLLVPREPHEIQDDPVQKPSEPYNQSALSDIAKSDMRQIGASTRITHENANTNTSDDIWAQPLDSSSPLVSRATDEPKSARSTHSRTHSEMNVNPLKSLDLNVVMTASKSSQTRRSESTDMGNKSVRGMDHKGIKDLRHDEASASDFPLSSTILPVIPSQPSLYAKASQAQSSFPDTEPRSECDAGRSPLSSSFQAQVSEAHLRDAAVKSSIATNITTALPNTKENIPPKYADAIWPAEPGMKPSAVWSSMNALQLAQRNNNFTGKDGREVSSERIEAARARIAARARGTAGA